MASIECPICSRHVRVGNLPLHVETCLTKPKEPATPLGSSSIKFFQSHTSSSCSRSTERPAALSLAGQKRQRSTCDQVSAVSLAEKMRPKNLDDLVGQEELVGPGSLLATLIQADRVPNMILWGPPGCGKTTLANVISKKTECKFLTLSGATNVRDMKDAVDQAKSERKMFRRRTIVFVDEIHRLNKSQQDCFLSPVEDGTITLIGATTENPSFEVNNALLSRCRVFTLKKHVVESIETILRRAVCGYAAGGVRSLTNEQETTLPSHGDTGSGENDSKEVAIEAEDEAIEYLAKQCAGDARVALNCLEMALQTASIDAEKRVLRVTATHVHHCFAHRQTLFYDRNADMHYDCISALHKSVRGSDENATLYWLARMLEGGENPLYVARRLVRIASEDVGLAAPELLPMAVAAYQAAHFVGMPECDVVLAHVATMLARAPKSIEVYAAYKRAKASIKECDTGALPGVPLHLRNAPTALMKQLGYGKEYKYNPHYCADELKDQTYLPDELAGRNFFDQNDADQNVC